MANKSESRCIVVVSIGDRPWINRVEESISLYARVCKSDFCVAKSLPSEAQLLLPPLSDKSGRPNKIAYASKTYFAWDFIVNKKYDRVLVLDDTCCISSMAPDIFAMVPRGHLGYVRTGSYHAQISFSDIQRYLKKNEFPDIEYNEDKYMNSGVLLYDKTFIENFSPLEIEKCAELLNSKMPHQTLTYYLACKSNIPMHSLPHRFNRVPGVELPKEERKTLTNIVPYLKNDIYLYHVTGMYKMRHLLIPQVADFVKLGWDSRIEKKA